MPYQTILTFSTAGRGTRNITDAVAKAVSDASVQTGLVNVFVQHTSCSLAITENADPDVRRDLDTILGRLAPDGDPDYRHDLEGPDDMAAHARSVLTDTALTIPVGGARMLLGQWRGIYLGDPRPSPREGRVVVTFLAT